jgi:hypothetical protein
MLDARIPEGALTRAAERELLDTCSALLLKYEGVDPANERAHALVEMVLAG